MLKFVNDYEKYTNIDEGKVDTTKPSKKERLEKWKEEKRAKFSQIFNNTENDERKSKEFKEIKSIIDRVTDINDIDRALLFHYLIIMFKLKETLAFKLVNQLKEDEIEYLLDLTGLDKNDLSLFILSNHIKNLKKRCKNS